MTGLANSWFLVGPERLEGLGTNLYGQLLIAKLVLFVLMLALAADNRYRLTPSLGLKLQGAEDPVAALQRLRRSIAVEAALGAAILGLVAVMGTLPPPAAL